MSVRSALAKLSAAAAGGALIGGAAHVAEPQVANGNAETGQESRSLGRGTAPSVMARAITSPQSYRQELP